MTDCHPGELKLAAALPSEAARLDALRCLRLLDTPREQAFDELVELAAAICESPIGLMSLVDDRRQWFKSAVGLEAVEMPREMSFCDHAIRQPDLFLVEDARADRRFAANLWVTGETGVQFYAGAVLSTADGLALGTLCVIDRRPRTLTPHQQHALQVLARQVMGRIELRMEQRAVVAAVAERDMVAAGLAEYQEQLEAANDRLRNLAVTDELTGLKNRRAFEERLTFEFAMARRKRRALAVAIVDADNFKQVNDRFGHPAGDDVLQRLATALKQTVRTTDIAVRFGGEEFAVILTESDERSGLMWSQRVQRALAKTAWRHTPVTVSIGVAGMTPECVEPEQLVALADAALYRAKARGKNCAVGASELAMERAG